MLLLEMALSEYDISLQLLVVTDGEEAINMLKTSTAPARLLSPPLRS